MAEFTGYLDADMLDSAAPVREPFWRRWASSVTSTFRTTVRDKTDTEKTLAIEATRLLAAIRDRDKVIASLEHTVDSLNCEIENAKHLIKNLNDHIAMLRKHQEAQLTIDATRIAMAQQEFRRMNGGMLPGSP